MFQSFMIRWITRGTVLTLLGLAFSCQADMKWPDAGVPLGLAEKRAVYIDSLSYQLLLKVPSFEDSAIEGNVMTRFYLDSLPGKGIYLDFTGTFPGKRIMFVNGRRFRFHHMKEHILIPLKYMQEGWNEVSLDFIATNQALNRNPDFMYTLFVPDKARTAFPCFDQPDLKAEFRLSLEIPSDWIAISNGRLEIDTILPQGNKKIQFAATKPISTYLFAFTAGKFSRTEGSILGKPACFYHREPDSALVASNSTSLFKLHEDALDWLESYTGIDYPFNKFEFILLPSFQYSGMEHPGCIYYNSSRLLLTSNAGIPEKLRRASLIAHETAHMWFGDLVTMRWFNDVWMKEVFANFFAAKIVNPEFPDLDHEARFILTHYPRAFSVDRTAGANPVKQPLENLNNAGSLYGDIIYYKAPILMRQLEFILGNKDFKGAIREYLANFRYGNATWEDLIDILNATQVLSSSAPHDLGAWSEQWFFKSGIPTYSSRNVPAEGKGQTLVLECADSNARGSFQSFILTMADSRRMNLKKEERQEIKAESPIRLESGFGQNNIFICIDGRFYGYQIIGEDMIPAYFKQAIDNPYLRTRAALWITLNENFLQGNVPMEIFWDHLTQAIAKEDSPLLLRYLADLSIRHYWQYFDETERADRAPAFEYLLLQRAQNKNLARICMNTYQDIVISKNGVANLIEWWENGLDDVWDGPEDEIKLLGALAVRGGFNMDSLIGIQTNRHNNPDYIARLEFLKPVLSGDTASWDYYAFQLSNQAFRVHEPWATEGLRLLYHPLRSSFSLKYLPKHLELLDEVQRTGDIFFPKNWLEAMLNLQSSPVVLEMIDSYLLLHPDLDIQLRGKLLQSADPVKRSLISRNKSVPLS